MCCCCAVAFPGHQLAQLTLHSLIESVSPQVFTTAASDESPQIVRLAFDTVEKIVREHFHFITGTQSWLHGC
jgi:hypothetical protein